MVPGGSMRRSFWDQAFSTDGRWGFGRRCTGAMDARYDEEKTKRMWAWMDEWMEANATV